MLLAAMLALLPHPGMAATLLEVLAGDGRFGRFVELVRRAGLADLLERPGPMTVLAPTDAAFAVRLVERVEERADHGPPEPDPEALAAFVRSHILPGEAWTLGRLSAEAREMRTEGDTVLALRPAKRGRLLVVTEPGTPRRIRVAQPDIAADNGIIQALGDLVFRQY